MCNINRIPHPPQKRAGQHPRFSPFFPFKGGLIHTHGTWGGASALSAADRSNLEHVVESAPLVPGARSQRFHRNDDHRPRERRKEREGKKGGKGGGVILAIFASIIFNPPTFRHIEKTYARVSVGKKSGYPNQGELFRSHHKRWRCDVGTGKKKGKIKCLDREPRVALAYTHTHTHTHARARAVSHRTSSQSAPVLALAQATTTSHNNIPQQQPTAARQQPTSYSSHKRQTHSSKTSATHSSKTTTHSNNPQQQDNSPQQHTTATNDNAYSIDSLRSS